jgi:hypothetical protein
MGYNSRKPGTSLQNSHDFHAYPGGILKKYIIAISILVGTSPLAFGGFDATDKSILSQPDSKTVPRNAQKHNERQKLKTISRIELRPYFRAYKSVEYGMMD